MTDDISGDGGYTGNADGAGYTGYDPGPNQSSGDTPAPSQPHEIYDPPIEHDPIGQAIVGLPFALATGVGEVVAEGASVVGAVGKEVVAWGVAELGLAGADAATEGGSESGEGGAGGAGGGSSEDSSGGYGGSDAGVPGGTEY